MTLCHDKSLNTCDCWLRFIVAACLLGSLMLANDRQAGAETWVGLHGNHSVEAKLLGIWEENAILEKSDGSRVAVPLINLRSDSRILAQKVARTNDSQQDEFVKELMRRVAIANAPAPDPLPTPPAAPAYEPLEKGLDALASLEHTQRQAANGHVLLASFDALPEKYRQDIEAIATLAAEKLDAAGLHQATNPLHRLGDLVVTRQNWIFRHPRMQSLDEDTRQNVRTVTLGVAGILQKGLAAENLDPTKLASTPFRDWLVEQDNLIAPYIYSLADLTGLNDARFEEVTANQGYGYGEDDLYGSSYGEEDLYGSGYGDSSEYEGDGYGEMSPDGDPGPGSAEAAVEKDEMKVKRTVGGASFVADIKRIDGFWVSAEVAENWDERVNSIKQSLQQSGKIEALNGPVISGLGIVVQPMLDSLTAAEDAESFHLAIEKGFQQMQSLTAVLAPAMDAAQNTSGWESQNTGRGNNPYGEDPYGDGSYGDGGYDSDEYDSGSSGSGSYGNNYGRMQDGARAPADASRRSMQNPDR